MRHRSFAPPATTVSALFTMLSLVFEPGFVRADPTPFAPARPPLTQIASELAWDRSQIPDPDTGERVQKPLFVDIETTWCGPCAMMHETTYRDPTIVDAASAFTTVRIDADQQGKVAARLKINKIPTLMFFDRQGEEIARLSGYVPAPRLHRVMSTIAKLLADSTPTPQIRDAVQAALERP